MSGLMAGLEAAPLPADWRARTRIAFPLDPPARRGVRIDYPMGWFHLRRIPVVAQRIQVDTYVACIVLSEALRHVVDAFARDYLVEHVEHILETRLITGYYPHLALTPGQRFASKGGYLMRFAEPTGARLVADGAWLVP